MRSYTYQQLDTAMQDYFEDFDSEFRAQIPALISQGETRVYGDLGLDTMMTETQVSLPAAFTNVNLPANCISPQEVRLGTEDGPLLKERTVAFVNEMLGSYPAGDPEWWAPTTVRTLRVAPARPAGASSGILWVRHSAPEEQLDSSTPNSTTWVSTVLGDLLLMSCLAAGETFNKHVEGETARLNQYGIFLAQSQGYLEGRGRTTTRV